MNNLAFSPLPDAAYTLRRLHHSDVDAMVGLQAHIMQELGDKNGHFIIPKLEARFAVFTEAPHLAFGAIAPDGTLAAMALVGVPNVLEPAAGPDSGLVQSVFVESRHRSQGLMDLLLQGVERIARQAGVTTLSSRIAVDNNASRRGFERNGYQHYGKGKRDLDGTPLMLFRKDLVARPNVRFKALRGK